MTKITDGHADTANEAREFGERLSAVLQERGWSADRLHKAMNSRGFALPHPVHREMVRRMVVGEAMPSPDVLACLAKVLGVSVRSFSYGG